MATNLEAAIAAHKSSLDAEFVRLTLDLSPPTHTRLKTYAKSHGVPMSALLRIVVGLALDEAERKQEEAQQATA
ncbi:hypothetical protein [Paraburkholderia tropica]|uniref:hypothetical protein n=1 Tax=Paraburkholderia tropica TaxID=92647 RepID=UPI002AB1588D|nr:hypothetical protein [Paraburkholderia tropica]